MIEVIGGGEYELVPFPEERKKIEIHDFYSNYTKISKELGWELNILLREGLKLTLDYYRHHGEYYWN